MGRFIKWLLIGLGGLVGLVLVFVVGVVLFVDPNDYRGQIEQQVAQQTGRELTIEGELGLTFFPWFGIEVGPTRLADAQGFGDKPFAAIERVQLAVKVLPLLSGQLKLDTVILDGPRVRLIRNAEGRANWEQFPKGDPAAEPKQGESPQGEGESGGGVPAIVRTLQLDGVIVREASVYFADRQAGTEVTVEPFNLELQDVRLGEPVPIEADWRVALAQGPRVDGALEATATVAGDLSRLDIQPLELSVTATGDAVPGGEQTASLSARVGADLKQSVFNIADLTLEAAGASVTGDAEARVAEGGPRASGTLTVPEFSPRELMEKLGMTPPTTRDPDVLGAASAELKFRFEGGRIQIEPLTARLDDTKLDGNALVRDPAQPAADFRLAVDGINVDRYLPPPSDEEKAATEEEGEAGEPAAIPTEPLRRLDLDGTLTIGELTVSGAKLSQVEVTVKAKDGNIRVHPLGARLYEGAYSGDIRLDATGDKLGVSVNEKVSGIQAQPLLTDLAGFGRLLGAGDLSLNATTRGGTVTDLMDALKGKAQFGFRDGTIEGMNIAQMLRQGMARLQGGKADGEQPQKTDFSQLNGTVRIDGGTLSNDDLSMKTPLLRVNGAGSANLIKRELDYRLTLNVVGSLEGQGGADLQRLKGVPVPLRISGSFTDPAFDLALGDKLDAIAKEKIAEEKAELKAKAEEKKAEVKKKAKEELKEKAEEQMGDKLKGLFN